MARPRPHGELRRIPSVDSLLRTDAARHASQQFGRPLEKLAIKQVLDGVRRDAGPGAAPPDDVVVLDRALRGAALSWYRLKPVVNATGVILHTAMIRTPAPRST